ncbi:MAG: T9SS type A sorting domain-containing protein [Flavobacterium sp.]|nr:T9SS type A sorting domain-containing protein [Flavobacterium sp.]
MNYNGTQIPIQNQFSSPDIIYNFPINFGNTDTSTSGYTTSIPTLYYQNRVVTRTNIVDGWGTVITPNGTYTNTLRIKSNIVQNDTTAIGSIGLPRIIRTSRELKWLDTSKKYPILIVTQDNVANNWVTSKVEYMDIQRNFQTTALFVYSPIAPTAGATANFQNLSTNGTTYNWNFDDPTSGTSNTSTLENPNHIFAANGTYQVTLTTSNASFTDTVTINVVVSDLLASSSFTVDKSLKIFPNPFSNFINIENEKDFSKFVLTNTEGKILFDGSKISSQNFDYLASGIYFLKAINENKIIVNKLIKQ